MLDLYERHYLQLELHLRPILRALILSLLPGLEEEISEHFERVMSIFDRVQQIMSPALFFQNIWLIILTTPIARGSALNLLSKRLPKFKVNEGREGLLA